MHFNYSILFCCCLLNISSANCDCESYLECLNDFVRNFFAKNETVDIPVNKTNLIQVEDIDLDVVNKVLSDVTDLLRSELDVKSNKGRKAVYKNVHDHTKIFVKSFVTKSDEKVNEQTMTNLETNIEAETTTLDNLPERGDAMKSLEKVKFNESPKINEIPDSEDEFSHTYYDIEDDNSTDYPVIDYLEFYKDTTNEDTYVSTDMPTNTEVNKIGQEIDQRMKDIDNIIAYTLDLVNTNATKLPGANCNGNTSSSDLADLVYPWVASIFIKNDSSANQFQYYCDGALLSERAILTAAKCVTFETTVDPENLLVVLGKKSLQSMAESEMTLKIKEIYTHDNFTDNGVAINDLAILVIEEDVEFSATIRASCITEKYGSFLEAATTAWDITGTLHPVYFEKTNVPCDISNKDENTFCATYGNHIPLCPNYGGIYITKQHDNQWYLQGIRTGDPTSRGLCFDKTVTYTSLKNHTEWIAQTVEDIKLYY